MNLYIVGESGVAFATNNGYNGSMGKYKREQGRLYYEAHKAERQQQQREWYRAHHSHMRRYGKSYAAQRRSAIIAYLGGKCVKCGFSDERALAIDHIHPIGAARETSSSLLYRNVYANTPDYQLLCANCNTIKKFEDNGPAVEEPEIFTTS